MDLLTFISNLVDSLAWPITVGVVIYLLREKIGELLPRLKRLKHKDTELEFVQGVEKLASERSQEGDITVPLQRSDELRDQYQFLIKLANVSPRSAVQEAFRVLETAAAKRVARLYPDIDHKRPGSPLQLQKLLKESVLSKDEFNEFNKLRMLRNEAAHAHDFEVSGMPIEAYIDIALSLAARLDRDAV